jgi:hypothetical protein
MFLGSVGDFLQLFLVRPNPEAPRILDGKVKEDTTETGLWNLHVGTDGGMHMRSVKEVFIEKTNWIRVPVRQFAPDDPEGDDAQKLSYESKEPFEFNRDFNYQGNPFAYALQIRDYLAYINEKENYQNFKAHKKDFFVSENVDEEEHVGKFGQIDQETSSTVNQYELKTAGIYLMPNGGITIRDAWNSSIVLEGGNVYIQPAKDLVMQPLRNTVVKAGGFINMACKYHLDLSSSEEGLRIKTDKSQYFYSDNGGVVVEANGSKDTPGDPSPDDQAIDYVGGIVLKSKLSIYRYAEKDILDYTKKQLLLQSKSTIDIVADQTATVYGKQNLHLFSDGMLLGMAQNTLIIAEGGAMMAGAGSTVLGQQDQNLGVKYDEKSTFVDVIKGVLDTATLTSSLSKAKEDKEDLINKTTFEFEDNFDILKFKFLKSEKYKVAKEQDAIPMTIAQQDSQVTSLYSLSAWNEKEVNSTLPYPGKEMFSDFYCASEGIVNLEKKDVSKDYTNMASPESKPGEIRLESLYNYKVQS